MELTLRLLDLWPDSRQRDARLIEELSLSEPDIVETETVESAPRGSCVQSVEPWIDGCISRNYHALAIAERRTGSPYFLDVLPEAGALAVRDRKATVILDGSIEGGAAWPVRDVAAVYDEFAQRGFDKSRLLLVNANFHLSFAQYRGRLASVEPAARLFLHNCYFSKAARVFAERHRADFARLRELCLGRAARLGRGLRDYMCLNYLPRPHRVALISRLIADDLFDAGYISCSDLNNVLGHKKIDTSVARVTQWLTEMFEADAGMIAGAAQLRRIGRLVLDEDLVEIPLARLQDS